MLIEDEVFKRSVIDEEKLAGYGFIKQDNEYIVEKNFMNNSFKAIVKISNGFIITGKIIDLSTNEEYINFRIKDQNGEFVSSIRDEYKNILIDIRNKCFHSKYFIYEQSNRLASLIYQKYMITPEFLWNDAPFYGVFRNKKNNKWFGLIMNIDKSKIIKKGSGEVEVLNIKLDNDVKSSLKKAGIYPAYHMNKKNWVSIILDDTLSDNDIFNLIDISYNLSLKK